MRATSISVLSELDYFDGEEFITFDALAVDCEKMAIRLSATFKNGQPPIKKS